MEHILRMRFARILKKGLKISTHRNINTLEMFHNGME
jgi:hypothetical protein